MSEHIKFGGEVKKDEAALDRAKQVAELLGKMQSSLGRGESDRLLMSVFPVLEALKKRIQAVEQKNPGLAKAGNAAETSSDNEQLLGVETGYGEEYIDRTIKEAIELEASLEKIS